MSRRDRGEDGFTLIEIAVVLVIIALAYGLVTPAFSSFVSGTRLESAARDMALALREARSTAIVTGRELQFLIEPATPGWRFGDRHGSYAQDVTVKLETLKDDPAITFYAITFYADGHSTGGRVRLESDGRGRIIEIHWLTGRVSQITY